MTRWAEKGSLCLVMFVPDRLTEILPRLGEVLGTLMDCDVNRKER